jgi:hypothetical protein
MKRGEEKKFIKNQNQKNTYKKKKVVLDRKG